MQECNPPRNSQLQLIETVSSRGRSNQMLGPRPIYPHRIDRLPMPQKTHATSCGAAASIFLLSLRHIFCFSSSSHFRTYSWRHPRCRASIRTRSGPVWARCMLGSDFHVPGPPSLTDLGC